MHDILLRGMLPIQDIRSSRHACSASNITVGIHYHLIGALEHLLTPMGCHSYNQLTHYLGRHVNFRDGRGTLTSSVPIHAMHRPIDARERRDVFSKPHVSFCAFRRNAHRDGSPVTGKFMANDENFAIILVLHTSIIAWVMVVGIGHRATSSCRQAAATRSGNTGVRIFEAEGQTAGIEERGSAGFKRTRRCFEC